MIDGSVEFGTSSILQALVMLPNDTIFCAASTCFDNISTFWLKLFSIL